MGQSTRQYAVTVGTTSKEKLEQNPARIALEIQNPDDSGSTIHFRCNQEAERNASSKKLIAGADYSSSLPAVQSSIHMIAATECVVNVIETIVNS